MKKLIFLNCFISLLASCYSQKINHDNRRQLKQIDVAYGSFTSSKMDVFLPANRSIKTPFVILIHGGAWISGDKIFESKTQDSLLAHGIASVNINYRLADSLQIHYPQILSDIDSAINYCIAHADEWHTRRTNFITSGTSAGAHLSLLYAYTTNKKISAIIAGCPPTDLTDTSFLNYASKIGLLSVFQKLTGTAYLSHRPVPSVFSDASPIHNIQNIPTLIIHGTIDKTVPYSQAVNLDKKLASKKFTHKLVSLDGADHDLNPKPPMTINFLYNEMVAWAWKYGK